jgi:hypothetical protein
LLKETMEQLSVFNVFDTRDPPKLSVIACGSRDVSLNCRGIPSLMCTGLGLLIDWGAHYYRTSGSSKSIYRFLP